MPTRAPAAANAIAIALPIPELAPVTTVRRPASGGSPVCAINDSRPTVRYASAPAANGWRALGVSASTLSTLGSPLRARAIDIFTAS